MLLPFAACIDGILPYKPPKYQALCFYVLNVYNIKMVILLIIAMQWYNVKEN